MVIKLKKGGEILKDARFAGFLKQTIITYSGGAPYYLTVDLPNTTRGYFLNKWSCVYRWFDAAIGKPEASPIMQIWIDGTRHFAQVANFTGVIDIDIFVKPMSNIRFLIATFAEQTMTFRHALTAFSFIAARELGTGNSRSNPDAASVDWDF